VTRLMNFGAFLEVLPGKEGLLHISELGDGERVARVEDAVKVGDEIQVRVKEIDNLGRINLTKRLTPGPEDDRTRSREGRPGGDERRHRPEGGGHRRGRPGGPRGDQRGRPPE